VILSEVSRNKSM